MYSATVPGTGFTIDTVTCRDDHTNWSATESADGYGVVLVRRGQFRRSVDGRHRDIDRTLGYLRLPHQEERFAHPWGGDVCTWIRVDAPLWRSMAGDRRPAAEPIFYIDARLDLIHRLMLAAARAPGSADDVTHHLHSLLTTLLMRWSDRAMPAHTPPRSVDRAAVGAAREAILLDHPESRALTPLAASLGVSPFRLSRAFSREMGVPMSRYRNRVRLARALDRLENGANDLAGLAAELGFADQAHLCRTARQHLGHTPAALGRLLRGQGEPPRPR